MIYNPNIMNTPFIKSLLLSALLFAGLQVSAQQTFTAAEQQQISIETPGLFARSSAFNVDFSSLRESEYSFPFPVGKATLNKDNTVSITTKEGDAVKAMFEGTVRLSRKHADLGNVIVIRHRNGLETVYAGNAQNLVSVGKSVKAGQTIAIVGTKGGQAECTFSIMVNGGRINPQTLIDLNSHRLRRQTLLCERRGSHVNVSVTGRKNDAPVIGEDKGVDVFENSETFKLDLMRLESQTWSYPLPDSKVISPYGGRRNHAGVDLKTTPNDNVLAAFDGVVTRSSPYAGYGNCIVIKHSYGLETLYSHQSKNLVKVGDKVKAGQVIGLTGRTGRATTEHLHFEVHFKGRRFDPALIFDHVNRSLQQSTLTLNKSGRVSAQKNMYASGRSKNNRM